MVNGWTFNTVASMAGYTPPSTQAALVLDTSSHILYYDADGSGAGAATAIATVQGDTLHLHDITVHTGVV
jgi:hypothetical protein